MIVVAKIFFVLFVSLVLAVVPISVFARQFEDSSAPESAHELGHSDSAGALKGIKAFENVFVPIRRAIAIAETRAAGAKIVDIDFDEESGQVAYKVKTYQHNEIWTGTTDASTGEIIGEGVVTPVESLEGKEKAELANFRASGMDLSEAIAIAEEYGVGSAVSAGLEEQNGKPIFVVVVVADGRLKEVSVEMARSCRVNKRIPRSGAVGFRPWTATARRPRHPRLSKDDGSSIMPGYAPEPRQAAPGAPSVHFRRFEVASHADCSAPQVAVGWDRWFRASK